MTPPNATDDPPDDEHPLIDAHAATDADAPGDSRSAVDDDHGEDDPAVDDDHGEDRVDAHLQDVEPGAGCTEIWEHLSETRDE